MARPRRPARNRSRIASAKRPPSAAAKAAPARPPRQARAAKGQWVYAFGGGKAEGRAGMNDLLGGKGAGLAEMANLGLPVPPGFTITTEVCTHYYANGRHIRRSWRSRSTRRSRTSSRITGKTFGDRANPLLVSVRSGARASMPGMMDTVLNLGLNDETVEALAKQSGDRRFAYDSYRRFITDVFQRGARRRASQLRGHPRGHKARKATRSTPS